MIKHGIFPNLSNEDYHSDKAVSRSGIILFDESPLKYWANYINPNRPKKESTKAMDFGSAFHAYILEPELFIEQYAIQPFPVLLKIVGREIYDMHKAECLELQMSGKIILTGEEFLLLQNMDDALRNHPEASELIFGGTNEQSYFWQDKESGLHLKARPDILHNNMYVDLKTCVSASTYAYQRAMVDGGLHIQSALVKEAIYQLEGKHLDACINICIEKTYPHEIGIKIISESALEIGYNKFKEVSVALKQALEYNEFKSYEPEIVELPRWMR